MCKGCATWLFKGNKMISIKEYAKSKGVSYEAVRKQVARYEKELKDHVKKVNRTKYLDDEAVAFLDEKRADNPIIIMESSKDEEIQRLEMENKALLLKVAELQEALLKEKDQVKFLQNEKIELLEEKNQKAEKKWWQFWE